MHLFADDLPELQAVQTDSTPPALFQLGADVSHQECSRPSWSQHTSNSNPENAYSSENGVNWLTELANIATSPQSPLMQCAFYNRYWHSFQFWTREIYNPVSKIFSSLFTPSCFELKAYFLSFYWFCESMHKTHLRAWCKSCLVSSRERHRMI